MTRAAVVALALLTLAAGACASSFTVDARDATLADTGAPRDMAAPVDAGIDNGLCAPTDRIPTEPEFDCPAAPPTAIGCVGLPGALPGWTPPADAGPATSHHDGCTLTLPVGSEFSLGCRPLTCICRRFGVATELSWNCPL